MDVVVVGLRRGRRARPPSAGLALAVYAGGSLVAGLVYGVARLPGTLAARFVGTRGLLRRWPPRLLLAGRLAGRCSCRPRSSPG